MRNYFVKIKYFKPSEFDSPDVPGTGIGINYDLVVILDRIRHAIGRAIIINSGVRTIKHNRLIGGVDDSENLDGNAADVNIPDSEFRYFFIFYALKYGIERLFIYERHIHVGIDHNKPHPVIGYVKPEKQRKNK